MYYLITAISLIIGLFIGILFENRRIKIKSEKYVKKHLEDLDQLITKIDDHKHRVVEIDIEHQIEIIEHSLNQALSEERYEDAAQLRDILKGIKKQK